MTFKIGDKIRITDGSYAFAIYNGKLEMYLPANMRSNVTVVATGLAINKHGDRWDEACDLMVADEDGNYAFTQSGLCRSTEKQIEIRYFIGDEDVTDDISAETKRNLKGN